MLVRDPPILFHAALDHPITAAAEAGAVSGSVEGIAAPIWVEPGPPWGIVTTQTCDLQEADEGGVRTPKRPWFTVAPVYFQACSLSEASALQRGKTHAYLFAVPALGATSDGLWVADLRLEVPIEKGWLVGRDTQPGFKSEGDSIRLAGRLSLLKSRFAFPFETQAFIDACTAKLRQIEARCCTSVEGRFECGRTARDPEHVRLVVLTEDPLSGATVTEIREWSTDTFHLGGVCPGLIVADPLITTYSRIDPRHFECLSRFEVATSDAHPAPQGGMHYASASPNAAGAPFKVKSLPGPSIALKASVVIL